MSSKGAAPQIRAARFTESAEPTLARAQATRKPEEAARSIRAAGLASLLGWIWWLSARFEGRPLWHVSLREAAAIVAWAVGIHAVIRAVEALTWRNEARGWPGYARPYGLMLFCGLSFLHYMNAHRVGPIDAQWYENMTADATLQERAGTFPVTMGATVFAFNGAVHPFRSAPWQFVLADGVDILTGRVLARLRLSTSRRF